MSVWYLLMIKGVIIALISGVLSAFAQILLKKSTLFEHDSFLKDYLNPYVITGYGLTACCMILMILAYRTLPFKLGAVLESLVYLYIMALSNFFFKERISQKKMLGALLIIFGIAIFSL